MTNITKLALLLIVLLSLSLIACSSDKVRDASNCQYNRIGDPADYKNTCGLYVEQDTSSAHLKVRIDLETGSAEWTLREPNGETSLTGTATAGLPVEKEFIFDNPLPGRWEIEFAFDGATGEYETPWTVK